MCYDMQLLCWLWESNPNLLPALLIKASPSHSATVFDDQADLNRSYGKFKRLSVSQVRSSESKTVVGLCLYRPSIPTCKSELNPCANYLKETPDEF